MTETAKLNLRVDAFAKKKAEAVLDKLGVSMSDAVDKYLYKIALAGDISFLGDLPLCPPSLNADLMADEELWQKKKKGIEDVEAGRVIPIEEAFKNLRENNKNDLIKQ